MARRLVPWLVLCLWSCPLRAGDLEDAAQLVKKLEHSRALQAVERALKAPANGPRELVEAYRIQGICQATLGKTGEAVLAFRRLLAIDPEFRLAEGTSPKIAPAFYQASGLTKEKGAILLAHQAPKGPARLGGLELEAELKVDPLDMVRAVRLRFWGETGGKDQVTSPSQGIGRIKLRIPADFKGRSLRYTFEALNEHGGVVAQAGGVGQVFELQGTPDKGSPSGLAAAGTGSGAAAGQRLVLDAPPKSTDSVPGGQRAAAAQTTEERMGPTPWYQTWWFWTVVGVAVAGAATGTAVALTTGGSADMTNYRIIFK